MTTIAESRLLTDAHRKRENKPKTVLLGSFQKAQETINDTIDVFEKAV